MMFDENGRPNTARRPVTPDWSFLRWACWRNAPLFVVICVSLSGLGLWAGTKIPLRFTSTATMMLEQAPGATQAARPRPGEAAPERLRVIAQRVTAHDHLTKLSRELNLTPDLTAKNLKLLVISGREKATLLTLEASAATPDQAYAVTEAMVKSVRQSYAQMLSASQHWERSELEVMRQRVSQLGTKLQLQSRILGLIPGGRMASLSDRLEVVSGKLDAISGWSENTASGSERARLDAKLNRAKTVYSDTHPKVRMIQLEIDSIDPLIAARRSQGSLPALREEHKELSAELARISNARAEFDTLEREHVRAKEELLATQSNVAKREQKQQAELQRQSRLLSLVAPPTRPQSASMPSPRMAAFGASLIAVLLAFVICILRQKFDKCLRRPADLNRYLGIAPFAVFPPLSAQP